MALFSETDIDNMLTALDAEAFTHHDGSVEGRPLTGIFDSPSERAAMFEGGPGVVTSGPKLTVTDVGAAGIERGDALTRQATGETYYLIVPEPDGAGLTALMLSEDEVS